MNFLLDVNASGAVAQWLIHQGHDIVEVGQKDPKMSDDEGPPDYYYDRQ
jgi:hypothetical protein